MYFLLKKRTTGFEAIDFLNFQKQRLNLVVFIDTDYKEVIHCHEITGRKSIVSAATYKIYTWTLNQLAKLASFAKSLSFVYELNACGLISLESRLGINIRYCTCY